MKPTECTVTTAECISLAGINPKGLQQYLRDAKVKGRDYIVTGNPNCMELYFRKINGRIYFNRAQIEVLVQE